jgi:hypothetical protein
LPGYKKLIPVLFTLLLFADPAWAAPPNVSGFFYDPVRDGEGFAFEQVAPDRAAVYWFTYDEQGGQRWFVGDGKIDQTGMAVDEWVTTHGPQFGDAYDPEDVVTRVAGNSRFTFSDCNTVGVDYTIDDMPGSRELVRLTHVADLPCATTHTHQSGLTGSWFDPGRSGEGMVMHIYDNDLAVVVMFTYNSVGEQMWVMSTGAIAGDELVLDSPISTSGGRFGGDYDPDEVSYQPWGDVSVTLSCDQALLAYDPVSEDLPAGAWTLRRLTELEGLNCDAGATWAPPTLTCGAAARTQLTAERIDNPETPTLVDNSEFRPDASCATAKHEFNGRLQFEESPLQTDGPVDQRQREFPAIAIDLVTVGDHLVPVQPWLVRGHYSAHWEVVFSTGRIWSEPADGGRSRAVLPLTLSSYQWNEAHHGLLSFLFDDNGVSSVHFQSTQENLPWADNHDFRGTLTAQYVPGMAEDAYPQERLWRNDMATRLPVKPISDLKEQYGTAALADFNRGVPIEKISQAGVAMDSVLYLQDAYTRTGPHPFPEQMRHGAFSVSKTAGAAVSLLRLAEKYGESVFDELIRDHVEVTADHNGWDNVTFGDTLSMTTGIGDNSPSPNPLDTFADEGDESNPHWYTFNYSPILRIRLNAAFGFGNLPWDPGEIVRYNSSQTMILAVAMDHYVRSR